MNGFFSALMLCYWQFIAKNKKNKQNRDKKKVAKVAAKF